MPKRGRSRSRVRANYARVTSVSQMGRARAARRSYKKRKTLSKQVGRILKTIETKEGQWKSDVNRAMAHNNVSVITAPGMGGSFMNVFHINQGVTDNDMSNGNGNRLGDEITVQSVKYHAFIENALSRPKVYYRFMLVKCAKGDLPTRATLFKNNADNKMIDEINTERYTVIYQKIFNVSASNSAPSGPGVFPPSGSGEPTGTANAPGIATRIMKVVIPGRKFGRGGVIRYENGTNQVKFFDYVPLFVVYDWYGTPQDINNVGRINELYAKIRFKDA